MTIPALPRSGYWPLSKRRTLPTHRNEGLEIVLVMKGELTWHVEGRAETVPPGSVFFTLPWESHGSVRDQEPGCELYYVVIRLTRQRGRPRSDYTFHRELGMTRAATRSLKLALGNASHRAWPASATMTSLIPTLVAELGRSDASVDLACGLCRAVLIELDRSLSRPGVRYSDPAHERVRQFVRQLEPHAHNSWTLDSMAHACGLNRSRFTQIIKELTGDTPGMMLSRTRIARARHLLDSTRHSIAAIAHQCGFSSSQYFASVFKSYTGMTPSQARRRKESVSDNFYDNSKIKSEKRSKND